MGIGGRRGLRAVAIGVVCVLLAACSGDGKGTDHAGDDGQKVTIGDGVTTTTAAGDETAFGETPPGGPGGSSTTTPPRKQGTTTTTRRGTGSSGGTTTTSTAGGGGPPTTRAATAPDSGARGGPGAYARTMLQPARSQRIVIDLLVQPGAEPRQAAVDYVANVLREVSGKPVTVNGPHGLPAGDGTTTDAEIRELSDRHARTPQTAEQAAIRLLFLTGEYSPTRAVLGVAVRGDTAAVFTKRVDNSANPPLVTAAALETAVVTHEVGHLLGLVDLVLDTGREDPENEGHSTNEESVMHWAIESSLVGQVFNGPPPREFDAADRNDLATLRNGG